MKATLEMLKYATPFYEERRAKTTLPVGGYDSLKSRIESWTLRCLDEMLAIAKDNPQSLYDYLNMIVGFMTDTDVDFSGDSEDILDYADVIAQKCTTSNTWAAIYPATVEMFIEPSGPILIMCALKYDVLAAMCISNMESSAITDVFCGVIQVPDNRGSALFLGGSLMYLDFAKKNGKGLQVPLWAQYEPSELRTHGISVAFRRMQMIGPLDGPIFTNALDYRNLETTTRYNRVQGSCHKYPRSVAFSYDPANNFADIKAFRHLSKTFKPTSRYGTHLDVFDGPSLFGIKAGDVDLQLISSTCDLRRIGQFVVDINHESRSINFGDPQPRGSFKNIDDIEYVYYLFLKHTYQID